MTEETVACQFVAKHPGLKHDAPDGRMPSEMRPVQSGIRCGMQEMGNRHFSTK